jgi:hypothetical protein
MDKIEVSQSETDAQFIRHNLNEFNFNLVPHDNHELLNLIVRRQNMLIAGLIGDTYLRMRIWRPMISRTLRSIRNGVMLSLENLKIFRKVIQTTTYAKN